MSDITEKEVSKDELKAAVDALEEEWIPPLRRTACDGAAPTEPPFFFGVAIAFRRGNRA